MKKHATTCIIDDDAIAVFGLKRSMANIKFAPDLIVFDNGLDALEDFGRRIQNGAQLPTLMFIDLNMPVMDGWEFVEEFSLLVPSERDRPELFIMTSSIDLRDMEKAKTYGLDNNYLNKPVNGEELQRIVG